jgi:hypothetical protein
MIVYFAHPINTYQTEIEDICLYLIKDKLTDKIINPGDIMIQKTFADYRAEHPDDYMIFFKDLESTCDAIVYLPFRDGMVGAGIWYEVKEMNIKGGNIYEIDLENDEIKKIDFEYVDNKKLTVEDTRIRIKKSY